MSRCPNCAEVQEVNAHLRRRVAEALEEVARLTKERDDATFIANENVSRYTSIYQKHEDLWRENTKLREDMRVLDTELKSWRSIIDHNCDTLEYENTREPRVWVGELSTYVRKGNGLLSEQMIGIEEWRKHRETMKATDASGVLKRVDQEHHAAQSGRVVAPGQEKAEKTT